MKPYEAIIIFEAGMSDDKVDSAVAKFEKKIKESGGTDINISKWGNRKLAYSIKKGKKSTEGIYVMITFNAEGNVPNDLKAVMNVSEDILRYSVIASKTPEKELAEEKVEIEPSMILQESEGKASQRSGEHGESA